MKAIREFLLAVVSMILWIVALPSAGLFEATIVISDAIPGLVVQHEVTTKVDTKLTI